MKPSDLLSELGQLARAEARSQNETLSLIASDNYASEAVLSLMASYFNNKCSESYPGRRTYAGLQNYDRVENIAISLAKSLFGTDYANLQAYSGSNANISVMNALLRPGEVFLGMSTDSGGHYSHGHADNMSSHFFSATTYCTDSQSHILDYDHVRDVALRTNPKLIISGASYYPRTIDFRIFAEIAEEVGARHLSDISHISGLVIAGLHPSPCPYADAITSTTHKMLRGPRGAVILSSNQDLHEVLDNAVFPRTQGSCHMHKIAAIGACLAEASQPRYIDYIKRVKRAASLMAQLLISGGVEVLTGGTDTHMLVVKVKDVDRAIGLLEKLRILASPVTIDGCCGYLRFGTCALISRGISMDELSEISTILIKVIKDETISGAERDRYIERTEEIAKMRPIPAAYH